MNNLAGTVIAVGDPISWVWCKRKTLYRLGTDEHCFTGTEEAWRNVKGEWGISHDMNVIKAFYVIVFSHSVPRSIDVGLVVPVLQSE